MTTTPVSKASAAIKRIIAATITRGLVGKAVVIREVPASWEIEAPIRARARTRARRSGAVLNPKTTAWLLDLDTLAGPGPVRAWKVDDYFDDRVDWESDRPMLQAPQLHEALVVHRAKPDPERTGSLMEIIVQNGVIDHSAVSVATDALLAGKRGRKEAVEATNLCGDASSLCLALAEAHAAALGRGERGDIGKTKRSAAQLDREIAAALAHRR